MRLRVSDARRPMEPHLGDALKLGRRRNIWRWILKTVLKHWNSETVIAAWNPPGDEYVRRMTPPFMPAGHIL